ncbi:MAG TPA: hypothetical protein VFY60_12480 [Pyrinomonadaceae bacterium]|nr:hypothetical protein [Pyrinomonadaceae bacterium]
MLLQRLVDKAADVDVLFNSTHPFFFAAAGRKRFDHQSVELCVLHLFDPVVLEQALELRIEVLIIFDAVDVVALDHPFDVQRRNRFLT